MTAKAGAGREEAPAVSRFLAEMAHQRRASPHTLAAYRRDLARLQEFAADSTLETLEFHRIRRYAMQLHSQGLAPRSIARMLSAWRAFYRWLGRHGEIGRNPVDGIRAPKAPRKLPKALAVDQTKALLDAVAEDELESRDKAMFELFYSSGLRLAELAAIDWPGGLDLTEGEIIVTGKRGKTRCIPVGDLARTALLAWLALRPQIAAATEPALFVNRLGGRLSPRSIERRLARWAQKQGLGLHVHPHMLRHSFASHLLQSSGDLRAVQELLGHAAIGTTQIYTHLDFQHLAKVYDSAHPRARKK